MDSISGVDPSVSALPMDANGDGLTDLFTVTSGEKWQLSLSGGTAFNTIPTSAAYESGINSIVADYFGDGKQAAIVASLGYWNVYDLSYSANQGTFSLSPVAIAAPPSQLSLVGSLRVGSIEAEGLDDLVYASASSGGYTFYYALHAGYNATPGDLVTQVKDGFGNYSQFTYASLASGSPTYTQSASPSYPTRLAASPMQVVSLYTGSDGAGGSYTVTYTYANAEMDTQGHGFLGFGSRNIKDSRYFNNETISYFQAFPFTGMVQQDVINANNGLQLEETDSNTWDYATQTSDYLLFGSRANHTDAYYPFFDTTVHHHYEVVSGTNQDVSDTRISLAAPNASPALTAAQAFDAFGNLTHQLTVVTDNTQGGAQYKTEQWLTYPTTLPANNCFAMPDTVTVTRTVPAGSLNPVFQDPATRTVTNTVDRTKCRLNSTLVTNSVDSVSLTTAYPSYDSYGNATEMDVSGTGISGTRVTTYSYTGGNNEFPTSVTHVVSGTDSITTASAWNYAWGIKASDTDPNGNATSYTPDDFGRPASVTRPDGSQTALSYGWCPGAAFCPSNAQYEITSTQVSGGTPSTRITTGYTAYDDVGRPVQQGTALLGGGMSLVDTTYNTLGDVATVSKPYTGTGTQYQTSYTYATARNRLKEIDAPQDATDLCSPTCLKVTTIAYSGFTVTTNRTVTNSASSSPTQTSSQTTDALGEVLNTVNDVNGVGSTTTYNYDAFGDLVATQDADGKLTTMTYDGLGHKTGMVDPNMGSWAYTVDALGEITCQTDAKGQSIVMSYDNVGRLASKLETAQGAGCGASGVPSTWTYDTQTKGVGLPASVIGSDGFERDYGYDTDSRPTDVTTIIPGSSGGTFTTSTTYDSFGRISTISYPASVTPTASGTAPAAVAVVTTAIPGVVGVLVTLDGSGSTDPNSLGLQYQWTQLSGSGPTLPVGAFDSAGETTSFTPPAGGVYNFQLQVIDSASALSAPASVSVTVKPRTFGAAPSIAPNPSTNGTVTLSWSAAKDPVDSYNVYRSTDNVNFTQIQNVTGLTATVTGLTNGTYYFAIGSVANGVNGDHGPSASELVTLPPGVPTSLNVGVSAILPNHSYTISWVKPGFGIITKYILAEDNNSGFTSPAYITVNAPAVSTTRSQSAAGTYYYKVQACNQTACANFSNVDSVQVEAIPSAPTLSASSTNVLQGDSTTLSWTPHSSPITSYVLQDAAGSNFSPANQIYSGTATSNSHVIEAETFFRVQACNGVGCSSWSNTVDVTEHAPSGGGGDGCHPICPLVMEEDRYSMLEPSSVSPGEEDGLADVQELSPTADLVAADLQPVSLAARLDSPAGMGTLAVLKQERQRLVAASPAQPREGTLQARFDHANSPAPSLAFAAPGSASLPSSRNLRFAPPVYQAYASAHLQAAGGTPYRFTVQYNYDPASGALLSVSNADTGFIYWRAATDTGTAPVDAFGHIVGYVDGNNVSTVSAYDAATGAVQGISTGTGASSAVQSLIYTWDGFGNLKQRCDTNRGLAENFSYDGLNRITGSTVYTGASYSNSQCSGGTSQSTLGMSYDAVGSIQTRTNTGITVGSGTLSDTYAYNDPSHPYAVTGVTSMPGTYAYDANGNMTSGNGRTITWNDDNLPVNVTSTSTVNGNNIVTGSSQFSYSPDLQRYQQVATDSNVAGNVTTDYVGGLFEIVSGSGTTQYRHNIVAAGGVVAIHTIDQSGLATTAYLHSDHLGSSDTITDDTGAIAVDPVTGQQQVMSFDAFGLRRDPNNWAYDLTSTQISGLKAKTDRGYTSQEQLDNVGLVHMNGRVYDPSIGRMISADPVMSDRYGYVGDNPLAHTDPSGYCFAGCFWQPSAPSKILSGQSNVTDMLLTGVPTAGWAAGYHMHWETQHNQTVQLAVVIVASYYTGGLAASWGWGSVGAGAVAGGTASGGMAALNSETPGQVLYAAGRGAVSGAVTAGLFEGANSMSSGWGFGGRLAANSFAGGTASYLSGGNFAKGAITAGLIYGAYSYYKSVVGKAPQDVTGGGDAVYKDPGDVAGETATPGQNDFGTANIADATNVGQPVTSFNCGSTWACEGMSFSKAADSIYGGAQISAFHDAEGDIYQDATGIDYQPPAWYNLGTMPPAAAVSYLALQYNPVNLAILSSVVENNTGGR